MTGWGRFSLVASASALLLLLQTLGEFSQCPGKRFVRNVHDVVQRTTNPVYDCAVVSPFRIGCQHRTAHAFAARGVWYARRWRGQGLRITHDRTIGPRQSARSITVASASAGALFGLVSRAIDAKGDQDANDAEDYNTHGRRQPRHKGRLFDMQNVSDIPSIVEPLFMGFNAEVDLLPVMNADDLKKGLDSAMKAM